MIAKALIATTQVDAHNMRITKEALEKGAQDINEGVYVPTVTVNHDATIIPQGKVIKAYVEPYGDGDYALFVEQVFFKSYSTDIDGQRFILLKNTVDNRPLITGEVKGKSKLLVKADSVNFETREAAKEYFQYLNSEYDIETSQIARKALIPDPELVFQFLDSTVKAVLVYLVSKQAAEKIGEHIVEHALTELDEVYGFIKKAIVSGAKRLVPKNRPVTYVFMGNNGFVVELIVQTTNPNTAIDAIAKERLQQIFDETEHLQTIFSPFNKIQFTYNKGTSCWEFNYLTTEKGEVIGTEKSYKETAKKIDLAFPSKHME